jgi:peptidoglycan DL-endopeptidase LytF
MRRPALLLGVLLLLTAVAAKAAPAPHSVLLVGDSLSIGLGKQLERLFADRRDIDFARLGKVSSGLARPDFFDWEKNLEYLAKAQRPDTVLIMIGANDNKSLTDEDGAAVYFEDASWDRLYAAKAARLLEICRNHNPDVRIFWVGAPIMGNQALSGDVKRINSILESLCDGESGCQWVDTWHSLADGQGAYAMYGKSESGDLAPLRVEDGVHVTAAGARILAGACLEAVAPRLGVDAAALMADAPHLVPADSVEVAMAMARENPAGEDPGAILRDGVPYVVKHGESLWRIAKRRNLDMERLLAFNPGIDADKVSPGQTIILPPLKARLAGASSNDGMKRRIADAKAAAASLHNNKYMVRQGDAFWTVAERFGISPARIAKANPGIKPRSLRPGMTLDIPPVLAASAEPLPAASDPSPEIPNTAGTAQNTAMLVTGTSGAKAVYTVAEGDNYWSIASRLGVSPADLEKANPGLNPRRLQCGQILNIPAVAKAPAGPVAETAAVRVSEPETYVISDGDNLWAIAKRFGVSVKALREANQDVDPKRLKPGQPLSIPERKAEITGLKSGHATKVPLDVSEGAGGARNSALAGRAVLHRIVQGDTLWGLARSYGASLSTIVRANQGLEPKKLPLGGAVTIPFEAFVGPASQDMAEAVPAAVAITVSSGDTLWDMARERGFSIPAILVANPGLDPLRLRVGQEIILPSPEVAAAPAATPLVVETNGKRTIQTYVTTFGDTLWTLSKRFGTTVERLAEVNGLSDPASLQAGQPLRIPSNVVTLLDF